MDPPTQMPLDPSNGVNDSKTKSKTKQKSVSIPIPQQYFIHCSLQRRGRQRRASTSVASTRGFTEDSSICVHETDGIVIYLADVAGSYEVHGRLETSYSPSPEVEVNGFLLYELVYSAS